MLQVKSLSDKFNSLTPGEFHKLNDKITIFARGRDKDQLTDIFLNLDNSSINSNNVIVAKKFKVKDGAKSSLDFEEGYSYLKKEDNEFTTIEFSKLSILSDSFASDDKEFNSGKDESGSYQVWSLSVCLMTILSVFIAVPISKISPRKGRYSRVLPGLLIFSAYSALLLSYKGSELIDLTAVALVHSLFLILALFLNISFLRSFKWFGS